MEYISKNIKNGIKFHHIKTDLFKTNLIAVFLTKKLSRENITFNTVIPAVLKRGSKTMPTQEEISKKLEEMYGATFDGGVNKTGDNHVIKFYMETLSDKYIFTNEDILKESIDKILQIIFNPLLENDAFKKEYVESEKNKIEQLIKSKIDNKDTYAMERCVEEMYKDELYGLYKYGYEEDIKNINEKNLYEAYRDLINTAKIDIIISGDFAEDALNKIIEENEIIKKLEEREPDFVINNETTENKKEKEENEIIESLNVGQGKLVIGMNILETAEDSRYIVTLFNAIFGGSATSKLFQNVREKHSLAYSIRSIYLRTKNNIFVRAGIEIADYERAKELINKELQDMKDGKFSEEDLENAKKFIIFGIKAIVDEQETGVTYYIGQELSGANVAPEEYIDKINAVTKEQIQEIANKIQIDTVYFLKDWKIIGFGVVEI